MNFKSVYMDYHATTPVDKRVVDFMLPFYMEYFGNAASLQHRYGWIAKEAVEIARKKVADSITAHSHEIIFTSGATESNNLALKGVADHYRIKGNHIITTQIEHASVLETCKKMERQGYSLTYLPVDKYGMVSSEEIKKSITPKTILVSVMMANNEIGTIQPMTEIGNICAENGILLHTDATQAVGKIPIDVENMNIHLLSFSSHKIYGPKGIGALYIRSRNPKVTVESQIDGAGHEHGVRSGTLNVPGIVGLGKAVQIAIEEMEQEQIKIALLRDALQEKLSRLDDISVNGHPTMRLSNNLNITIHGVTSDRLMTELDDVAVSAGSACTTEEIGDSTYSHVLKAIGLNQHDGRSTVRISLGRFSTTDEIEYVATRFSNVVQSLRTQSLEGVQ